MADKSKQRGVSKVPKIQSPITHDESLLQLNDSLNNNSLISLIPCRDDNGKPPGFASLNYAANNIESEEQNFAGFHHPNYFAGSIDGNYNNLNKEGPKEANGILIY